MQLVRVQAFVVQAGEPSSGQCGECRFARGASVALFTGGGASPPKVRLRCAMRTAPDFRPPQRNNLANRITLFKYTDGVRQALQLVRAQTLECFKKLCVLRSMHDCRMPDAD